MKLKRYNLPHLLIAVMTFLLAAGCTTNDGDIGFLGGHWRLDAITVNGTPDDSYNANITWAFQSRIIEMSLLGDNHERVNYFGTWSLDGNSLILDYSHSDTDHPQGTGEYSLPPQLRLPQGEKVGLTIDSHSGNSMTISGKGLDNIDITYFLSKIY